MTTPTVREPFELLTIPDLGYIDNEGFLFITGRRKSEIITRGGQNIYPEEVEFIMLESPFINEILVVKGLNNRTGDEEVHTIIYPNHEALCECLEMKNIEDISELNGTYSTTIQKIKGNWAKI